MNNAKNSKKSKNNQHKTANKSLAYWTIGGLILGTVVGTTITMITDNMFWMACAPLVCLFLGLAISSFIPVKKKTQIKNLKTKH